MIQLDGFWYSTYQNNYKHNQKKYDSVSVSNTGAVVHVDTGVFSNTYQITLICTQADLARLRGSFAKASFTNSALNLTDEEGFTWSASSGTDTSDTIYSSGVYFRNEVEPQPMTVQGWNQNHFLVPIELHVNAGGLASSGSGGGTGSNVTMVHETPGGTINGVNVAFTLTQTPSTLILFRNGVEQVEGVNYSLSGDTITFLVGYVPQTGDVLDSYFTV